jgi:2'-5' RNA ligase
MTGRSPEQVIYEKLWQQAALAFDSGAVRLDAFLKNQAGDTRRGVTLVARLDASVCARVKCFLDEIAAVAPQQHFYQPAEFHLTVLSVIPGSVSWRQPAQRLPDHLAALAEVLKGRPPFSVEFRGMTASPEAVMIQGFPEGNALAKLRDDLRAALAGRGLGENLDRRYKIATAHLTVVRFATPLQDWRPLKALLAANRHRDFGTTCFRAVQLIHGDWYASANTVRMLCEYPLTERTE